MYWIGLSTFHIKPLATGHRIGFAADLIIDWIRFGVLAPFWSKCNAKKCNLTLAMSPTCHSKSPLPIYYYTVQYFSWMHLYVFYIIAEFQIDSTNTCWNMNYYLVKLVKSRRTDGQTDAKWRIRAHRAKCTGWAQQKLHQSCAFSLLPFNFVYIDRFPTYL